MKGCHHQLLAAARTILHKKLINIKYQPIISLSGAMVIGFTVHTELQDGAEKQLLIQSSPNLKPDAIIKQLTLQPEFDLLQMQQLLSELQQLPHTILPDNLIFSISLSDTSLSNTELHQLYQHYEIPQARLEAEISLSALLNGQPELTPLHHHAVSLGMSEHCFEILTHPLVHTICLEPALTSELPDSDFVTKFVRSLNALSQLQSKNIRIKGIHQQQQLHFLRSLNSIQCQGALFGEAVSVHDIPQLIVNIEKAL